MYLLILLLPLLGSLLTGFLGRFLGRYGSEVLSTLCVFISLVLSILAFYEIGLLNTNCYLTLASWVGSGIFLVSWSFLFDSLTCIMLLVVTSISTLVHFYSIKYMENDPHCPRFMSYLQIFTFFMLLLVTSDNLIQMFVGWEGVGITSYLLVNFWYTRYWANQSALKALIINRIGDFSLSLGIFLVFYTFKSIDYLVIFSLVPFYVNSFVNILGFEISILTLISIFLFFGAVGKSAQLGLHTWLPDAMEGPTPVSALIHAATMVTAGVFLMIRFSPLLEYTPFTLLLMTIFGSITAFFASMIGIFQNDLKKIIAYSTCSQLGYMIFCCGLSSYTVSIFHLTNHAFFKALLFLCAGSVIHAAADEQDIRKMGSFINFLPLTYSMMLVGSLALVGFPFLTGFYSKDFILELSQIFCYSNIGVLVKSLACWLGSISVFFTAFYSFRLIYLTFINNYNGSRIVLNIIHESSLIIILPLLILALGSIFIGFLLKDLFIGIGTSFWNNSIFMFPVNTFFIESEYLPTLNKWLPFIFSLFGIFLASFINIFNFTFYKSTKTPYFIFFYFFLINKKWYLDILQNRLILKILLNFGYLVSFKTLDRGFIELVGPYGIPKVILTYGNKLTSLQTGQIMHYLFFMVIGVCLFLFLSSMFFFIDYRLASLFFLLFSFN